jgi:hypothetical protein
MKNFCAPKDTIKKMKNNPQNGRKYMQITSHKGLIYITYKDFYNSTIKGQTN